MIAYCKLWKYMECRRYKKTDLLSVISSPTLAKLGKNEIVSTETIDKLCKYLKCQPGDIMVYINDD